MKVKRIISIITVMCMLLFTVSAPNLKRVNAAEGISIQIKENALSKSGDGSITISLKDNTRTVAGIEVFIGFDTDIFDVADVDSLMSDSWEFDWVKKSNASYGSGIHCMLQDTALKGMTKTDSDIIKIELDISKAEIGKSYDFEVYVIDICDEQGESFKTSVAGGSKSMECVEKLPEVNPIQLLGYQISPSIHGFRTVSSVESEIDGKKVVEFGHVYAIVMGNVTETDMYVGSNSPYVKAFAATEKGVIDSNFTESTTNTNFVMTMINNGATKDALVQKYMVRAYAKLSDGTYVYSNVGNYTLYNVADYLYQKVLMPNISAHNYLYNNMLAVVDSNYKEVDYDWGTGIVKPR